MATYTKEVCEGMAEGHSISRPPLFTGKNYAYWKDRMKIFITSTDYQQWEVIEEGEEPILKEVDGKKGAKTMEGIHCCRENESAAICASKEYPNLCSGS